MLFRSILFPSHDISGNRINAALISADQVDAKSIAIEAASPEFTKAKSKAPKFGEYLLDAEMDMDLINNMHEFIDPTYDSRDKDVQQWNKDGIKNSKGSRVELQYMISDMAFVTFNKGGKVYPFKASDLNQKKSDKNKIYSVHEPDVQCISKGQSTRSMSLGIRYQSFTPKPQV